MQPLARRAGLGLLCIAMAACAAQGERAPEPPRVVDAAVQASGPAETETPLRRGPLPDGLWVSSTGVQLRIEDGRPVSYVTRSGFQPREGTLYWRSEDILRIEAATWRVTSLRDGVAMGTFRLGGYIGGMRLHLQQ